ncbi:MAG: acyl-CoA dehydrogenase [Deltaproteobacteria bacterium]|nr:MAG: acyl-CoA dehydrogenase [Deltaproteobacteria bacterium]
MPPVLAAGTEEQKQRWLPDVLGGKKVAALAVTEPGAGSDVGAISTHARREGSAYIVNGRKIFITSGTRADLLTCAVRTAGTGPKGISLLVIEANGPGVVVESNLDKMGWHPSDTASLVFENVRVPASNMVGGENEGFAILMRNFAAERLLLAASAVAIARAALEQALAYSKQRNVFGRPVCSFQVNSHRLAEMSTGIEVNRTYVYALAARICKGEDLLAEAAMAKNSAVDMAMWVVDKALQMHGGYGYMRDYPIERLYRDIRLYHIGGGTREVMNELIARRLLQRQ